MGRLPVSCFIIAKNEADRIVRTIRSVRSWVDEVVVVDSESADETAALAASEGCRVIRQRWLGFGGQKRFAENQCRNDWILNLDADEVVTPALKEEIIALFAYGLPPRVAYRLPLDLVYPNAERPRPWARDHWYVRLYDRRAVRFRDSEVHDTVVTGAHDVGVLYAPAYHYSFRDYNDLKQKLDERMSLSAMHADCSSPAKLLARRVVEFPVNFFKYYVVRRHFTGGFDGLRYAWVQATYRQLKVIHMWRDRSSERQSRNSGDFRKGDDDTRMETDGQGAATAPPAVDLAQYLLSPRSDEIYAKRA
jgi:glycosyltransferase involved in cell wall biosynthesis